MNRLFYQTKGFWAFVAQTLSGLGTTWAFVLDANLYAKATFASLCVISTGLQIMCLASRITGVGQELATQAATGILPANQSAALKSAIGSGAGDGNGDPTCYPSSAFAKVIQQDSKQRDVGTDPFTNHAPQANIGSRPF